MPKIYSILCLLLITMAVACTNDELPPSETPEFCMDIPTPTYDVDVKGIMDASCSYIGCHVGGGIGPGHYDHYDGLKTYLETGDNLTTFKSRVVGDLKDDPISGMPPNQSVYPESKKDDLTPEELEIIECWLDAGYPEK